MSKKVAIFGDSWSYGSWRKLPNHQEELTGVNFQKLFANANIVADNFSIQGGTNLDTIEQLKKISSTYDLLIVFQTDPIRQCLNSQIPDNKLSVLDTIDLPESYDFKNLCELLLRDFYKELENFNTSTLLIGGCTKLCFKHVPKSIVTLSQSWTEIVSTDFEDNYYYWVEPTLCLYEYARKKFNWKSNLADFFDFEKQILTKNYIWQNSDSFSWCHASDPAYKIMFEKIKEVLNDNRG